VMGVSLKNDLKDSEQKTMTKKGMKWANAEALNLILPPVSSIT
jgi:hypothetical protein